MAKTTQKKYQYKTKAIQLPDGTRKYLLLESDGNGQIVSEENGQS